MASQSQPSPLPVPVPEIFYSVPYIMVTIRPFAGDDRITSIGFQNVGNHEVPAGEICRAVLVPEGLSMPHLMKMAPNQQGYIVAHDSELKSIFVTLGHFDNGEHDVVCLVAVITLFSPTLGEQKITHLCCPLK